MSEEKTETAAPETVAKAEFDQLREKLDKEALRAEDLRRQLEGFKGISPEEVSGLRSAYKDLEEKMAKQGGQEDIDALVEKRYAEKLSTIENEWQSDKQKVSELTKKLHEHTVVDKVMGQIAGQFIQDPLVQNSIKDMVRKSADLGESGEIILKDGEGNVMRAPGSATQPMNLEQWASQLAEQNPTLVANNTKSGSRSSNTVKYTGSSNGLSADQYLQMSESDRAKLPREVRMKLAQSL